MWVHTNKGKTITRIITTQYQICVKYIMYMYSRKKEYTCHLF